MKYYRVLPGNDGEIIGAKVELGKTRNVIRRPVNRLYPLEVSVPTEVNEKNLNDTESAVHDIPETERLHATSSQPQSFVNSRDINRRTKRKAAIQSILKTRSIINN